MPFNKERPHLKKPGLKKNMTTKIKNDRLSRSQPCDKDRFHIRKADMKDRPPFRKPD